MKNHFDKAERFAKYFIRKQVDEEQTNKNDDTSLLSDEDKALLHEVTDRHELLDKMQFYRNIDTPESRKNVQVKINQESDSGSFRKFFLRGLKFAAVIVVIVVTGTVLFRQFNSEQKQTTFSETIQPGSLKATLVLSDGEEIDLTMMSSDSSIEKDGVKIINNRESIEYVSNSKSIEQAENKTNTLIVPRGGEWQLVMEDGTKVWINADSKLTFPSKFNKHERIVQLEGEAYFEVAYDGDWPFMVKTSITETTVLGTAFNIKAYSNEDRIETTLVEGKVALSQPADNSSILMDPGYQAIVSKNGGKTTYEKVNTAIYTSWKDKRFEFVDESLESIMKSLERWYNVDIEFSDDISKQFRFSTRLQRYDSIQDLLNRIEQTNRVVFSFESDKILVEAR